MNEERISVFDGMLEGGLVRWWVRGGEWRGLILNVGVVPQG
jgi:hypothetical protein